MDPFQPQKQQPKEAKMQIGVTEAYTPEGACYRTRNDSDLNKKMVCRINRSLLTLVLIPVPVPVLVPVLILFLCNPSLVVAIVVPSSRAL